MILTGQSTEAISHSSTLRAGIESAIRFTKTEMSKLEAQKVALNKDIEDSKNKLRDSERASRNLHINMALMERNVSNPGWSLTHLDANTIDLAIWADDLRLR